MCLLFGIICQCCRFIIANSFVCGVFLIDDVLCCWDYSVLAIDRWNTSMEIWWDETDMENRSFWRKTVPKLLCPFHIPRGLSWGSKRELRVRDQWSAASSVSCSVLLISVFISHKYVLCGLKIKLYIMTILGWSWTDRTDNRLSLLHLLACTLYHHVRVLQHLIKR